MEMTMADCEECEDTGRARQICSNCSGSGEGSVEWVRCATCKGLGEVMDDCPACDADLVDDDDDFDEPEDREPTDEECDRAADRWERSWGF